MFSKSSGTMNDIAALSSKTWVAHAAKAFPKAMAN
jgi:hypothetical protein